MVTNRHYQLDNLLRFLDDPDIEPTNSRAERMLLPTVITRKISQCSQTDSSAHTYAAFKSVLTTYALQAIDSVSTTLRELIAGNRDSTAPQAS